MLDNGKMIPLEANFSLSSLGICHVKAPFKTTIPAKYDLQEIFLRYPEL